VNAINEAPESKQFCSAAFLNISQAFDRVWHIGILHKLWHSLALNYFLIFKSYLLNRHFQVKIENAFTDLPVNASVPQGSVLDPLFYLLYTSHLPIPSDTTTATFADDTAVLATDPEPTIASHKLQSNTGSPHQIVTKGQWF
jgi:hypothetical protein